MNLYNHVQTTFQLSFFSIESYTAHKGVEQIIVTAPADIRYWRKDVSSVYSS